MAQVQFILNRSPYLVGSTHRYGGFVDDDSKAVHVATDGAPDGQHVLQVSGTVLPRRGADGDELDQRLLNRLNHVGGK